MTEFRIQDYALVVFVILGFAGLGSTANNVPTVDGSKNDKKAEILQTCDGHLMKRQAEITPVFKKCLDKHVPLQELPKDSTDEEKKKASTMQIKAVGDNMCLAVCQLQENKMLDDKGAFSKAGSDAYLDGYLPTPELAEKVKTALSKCAQEKGQGFSMENNCSSYKDYVTCIGKKFVEICKIDMTNYSDASVSIVN